MIWIKDYEDDCDGFYQMKSVIIIISIIIPNHKSISAS